MALSASFVLELQRVLGAKHVISEPEQLRVYECDGLTGHRAIPELVVLPGSTEEVQAVVRACHRERVPFVARGAGTGLSGGATPMAGGVVVSLARMNRILEIDLASQRVVVEPGVANLDVTRAVAGEGFFYAPDPSSQQVCTIGGNVAENSGGAHCLKNGFTVHHVTGVTLVLPDGEIVELGGKALDPDGPDLLGVVVGSEGTLGIVTRITLRLVRVPEAVRTLLAGFETTDAAGAAVSGIVAGGILPSALEMMDRLTIEAAELAVAPGYPAGAGAILLVELDGVAAQVEEDAGEVERICAECGAFEIRAATERPRARAALEGPQVGVRGDGPGGDRLLRAGRRRAADAPPRGPAPDRGALGGPRPARRERLPRGRREPPPARPLRRGAGRDRAGAPARRGDPRRLPRRGRLAHRRARGRHGQGLLDAADVLRARPRGLRAAAARVRPGGALQPRKGDPDAAALRRGAGPVSRASAREDGRCRASLASRRRPRRCRRRTARVGSCTIGEDLTTDGLDRILEHEAGDLTCTVEAGVRLSVLQDALGEHGQRLSLDPPGDPTVGALLARNLSGPLRHRFGAPRDLVLGVTLVLADGTIASAGGKVVKNVAGYDLARLVCGSRGTASR